MITYGDRHLRSGPHTPLSHDTPQETHRESGVEERPCEHHRTDRYYKRSTVLGVFLGAGPTMVCVITWEQGYQEGDHSQGTLQRTLMLVRTTATCKQPITKTRCYSCYPAFNTSWLLGSSASDRPTASQCGQTVRVGLCR